MTQLQICKISNREKREKKLKADGSVGVRSWKRQEQTTIYCGNTARKDKA